MPLINCKINVILSCPAISTILSGAAASQAIAFSITDAKLYVPVVTLSTQDTANLQNYYNN